jgi:hypothetical protein
MKRKQKGYKNEKKIKRKRKENETKNVHTKWKGAERQFFSMQLLKENFGFSLTFLSFSLFFLSHYVAIYFSLFHSVWNLFMSLSVLISIILCILSSF